MAEPSKVRAALFLKAALHALDEAGGSLPLREVKAAVAQRVPLTAHDLEVYEKTGYVRWESVLHFYSIDAVKAGFIRKQGGQWHLTSEGREVMPLPGHEILARAIRAYRTWRSNQAQASETTVLPEAPTEVPTVEAERSLILEKAQDAARSEVENFVKAMGPYELQELVAALLRAMGYSTPFIAPTGPDGGTDILAYPDPLGAKTPHIRVQVKHRQNSKATREEIAALRGIIRQDREIGLFVSTSGFTSEAVREARHGTVHIELMDMGRLLDQWLQFFDKAAEEDKGLLRLQPVYFLAPE